MATMPLTVDLEAPAGLYPGSLSRSPVNISLVNADSLNINDIFEIENIIFRIKEIFKRSNFLFIEDRNDIFKLVNTLREKLSLCPKAEYFHRFAFFRQAEKMLYPDNKMIFYAT